MTDYVDVAALARWIREFARLVAANKDLLTALDSAIGDADHGTNMDRGMAAVIAALADGPPAGAAALFKQIGMKLVGTVGGASGPLYGTFFLRMAAAVGDDRPARPADVRQGAAGRPRRRRRARQGRGRRQDDVRRAGAGRGRRSTPRWPAARLWPPPCSAAAAAAEAGRDATTPMLARKGRASYLGERSVGHQDPGATSVTLLLQAAAAPNSAMPESRTDVVVGLVVVSHSRALARAAVGLAREMMHATPARIEIAAGLDDTTFGTDATQIVTAITAADDRATASSS